MPKRLDPDLVVSPGASLRQVLATINGNGRQAAAVVDAERRLVGLVTDGDLRKAIVRDVGLDRPVSEAMNKKPITTGVETSRESALALMRRRAIRHLPVVDAEGRLTDLWFLDDLLAPPRLECPAVIMAGGEGRRLRPFTETTPKPLLAVGGRPLLEILVDRLRDSGVTTIVMAVRHKSEMIREHFGAGERFGVAIEYVEEPIPLGTIGALTLIAPPMRGPFFVLNGDILTKCDFRAMAEFHRERGAALTVAVSLHQVEIPYGEFTLQGDRVVDVAEKPRKEFPVNAGIYVLEPSVVELLPRGQYFDATDLLRLLLGRGLPVAAYLMREYWLDVGRQFDFEKANRDVAEGLLE